MLRRAGLAAITVITICLTCETALAQTELPPEPGRPFGGVFRGNRTEGTTEAVSLTVSVSEAYDNDIVGTQGSPNAPSGESGLFSRLSSQLSYAKRKDRLRFMAGGGFGLDYYNNLQANIPQPVDTYQGSAGIVFSTRRAVVQASQRIGYFPYFGFDLSAPGSPVDPGVSLAESPTLRPDAALLESPVVAYGTQASALFPLGRRSSTTFAYSFSGSRKSERWPTVDGQSASAQFSRSVSRSVSLNASYGYQFSTYNIPGLRASKFTSLDLMGGLSWSRTLSKTRSLSVTASAGRSLLEDTAISGLGSSSNLSAHGSIGLQFARSWTVQSDFHRSLQYVQGLRTPYYGNGFNLGLQGEPTRRLELSVSTGVVSSDSVAADGLETAYDTRNTSVHTRYALGRSVGIFAQDTRTHYAFGTAAEIPTGVLSAFDREVVQVGLTFGHLLFRR